MGARFVVSAPFFVTGTAEGAGRYDTADVQNVSLREQLERSRRTYCRTAGMEDDRVETGQNMDNLVRLLEEQKIDRKRIASQVSELQATLARRDATLADAARRTLRERVRTAVVTGAGIRSTGRLTLSVLFSRRNVRSRMKEQDLSAEEQSAPTRQRCRVSPSGGGSRTNRSACSTTCSTPSSWSWRTRTRTR